MTTGAVEWAGAVGVIGAVAVATFIINRWVSELDRNLAHASIMSDNFYQLANKLLDDNRTSLAVSTFVVRLSADLSKPRFASWVVKNSSRFERDTTALQSDLSKAFETLPEDLKVAFAACVLSALGASASTHPFAPEHLRKRLATAIQSQLKSETVQAKEPVVDVSCTIELEAPESEQPPEPVRRAVVEYVETHAPKKPHVVKELAFA